MRRICLVTAIMGRGRRLTAPRMNPRHPVRTARRMNGNRPASLRSVTTIRVLDAPEPPFGCGHPVAVRRPVLRPNG
jgi:hypothetical protein